ncbi:MAG: DUF4878 domain-containing protein [Chitinophagaceae bacterium]|nr:MAG: DUF4878 domain-containing protein [Chitinophagaceae bacterium]
MRTFLIAILVASVAYIGCKSSASGDPVETLNAFFDAMQKKDIATARKLATADSKATLDLWEKNIHNVSVDNAQYDRSKVEIGAAKIDGDHATVEVKEKSTGEAVNFPLKKEAGDWKVSMSMNALMKMGMDKMQEKGINITDSLGSVMDKLKEVNLDSLQKTLKIDRRDVDSAIKILEQMRQ